MTSVPGPFGPAIKVNQIDVGVLEKMYADKCGAAIDLREKGIIELGLFECLSTGVRFWRPERAAGDENFYRQLSAKWPSYYRDWRWEYGAALRLLRPSYRVLEIGCGRGFFLKRTENLVAHAEGLELNREAIDNKVTHWSIRPMTVEAMADERPSDFDYICSFQVLEHVIDPAAFIEASLVCLQPDGLLLLSTPNPEFEAHRQRSDAFDLPPHHMNHFSIESYIKIAERYKMKIELISTAPRFGVFDIPGNGKPWFLSHTKIRDFLMNQADKVRGISGATNLVAMRK